jgi:hypothetical protein
MANPDPPTPQQLKGMASHIYHEVMALMQSRDLLNHAKAQQKAAQDKVLQDASQVGINCALESFLLHYRNLREFLNDEVKQSKKDKATEKLESDDIKAKDYTIDPNWKTAAPWASDKDEGKRLHKRLAHITTARLTLDDKWYPESMEGNALRTFEEFVSAISDERKAWFEKASSAIMARVRPVMATLGESSNTLSVSRHSMTFHGFRFK